MKFVYLVYAKLASGNQYTQKYIASNMERIMKKQIIVAASVCLLTGTLASTAYAGHHMEKEGMIKSEHSMMKKDKMMHGDKMSEDKHGMMKKKEMSGDKMMHDNKMSKDKHGMIKKEKMMHSDKMM